MKEAGDESITDQCLCCKTGPVKHGVIGGKVIRLKALMRLQG